MFGKLFVAFSLASLAVAAPAPLPYVFGDADQATVVVSGPVTDLGTQPAVAPTPAPPAPAAAPATPATPAVAPTPQTTPAPAAPRTPRAPAAPRTPETAPTPPTPAVAPTPPPPRTPGQLANVIVEVVVTDQAPNEAPNRQSISATAADREAASVRNTAVLGGGRNRSISLDIRPVIAESARVRLQLGLEYLLRTVAGDEAPSDNPQVRLTQNVVLESGKPLVISQSTAPGTQRTVSVEVKATVLK